MAKRKTKDKVEEKVDVKYEITMYKLLGVFAVSILFTLLLGFWAGNVVGYSQGVDDVKVSVPDYCTIDEDGSSVSVKCLEVSNITAGDLCRILSTPLENKIKVMIVP